MRQLGKEIEQTLKISFGIDCDENGTLDKAFEMLSELRGTLMMRTHIHQVGAISSYATPISVLQQ